MRSEACTADSKEWDYIMDRDAPEALVNRRTLLRGAASAGAGLAVAGGLIALDPFASLAEAAPVRAAGDHDILVAAQIAEALAVTTYTTIIRTAPFFARLPADDQGYLKAARQEEMAHYLLEQLATGGDTPYTHFYYPKGMFSSARVTLNTLVSLEDAFIAAYLLGVAHFSSVALRLTAARIVGVESAHRTLARVLASDITAHDGGPFPALTGFQGAAESVNPPNNNSFERTLGWSSIDQAIAALQPFIDKKAAASAGFDSSKSYTFHAFTPTAPTKLGEFHGFSG